MVIWAYVSKRTCGINKIAALLLVVQEVMRQVIADVAEDTTAENGRRSIPVVEEDRVCELPEWCGESNEEGRWHDEAIAVHREVVVDTMKKEVSCYADAVVWEVSSSLSVDISRPSSWT